jgi:Leucine-rich repeat (LRR) protein
MFLLLQSDRKDVQLFTMHDLVHDLAILVMGKELLHASENSMSGGSNCRYAFLPDSNKPLKSYVNHPNKIRALHFPGRGGTGQCSSEVAAAKYLRVLDLGECSLENLPSSIGKLKLLRYLCAPGIKDRVIPRSITKLPKLIYLSLRESSTLSALPESLGEMEALMYLDLSGCSEIEKLPNSFGKLGNLVRLDLSDCCRLKGIPETFGDIKSLMYLDLSGCSEIEKLPNSFGKLGNLVHLDLSGCSEIRELPNSFGELGNLVRLDLSDCRRLNGIPESFGEIKALMHLDLSGCSEISELPNSFGELANLDHLDLSYCSFLLGIPAEGLHSLTKVQHLNLSNCRFFGSNGLHEVIGKLIKLRYLNLSGSFSSGYLVGESEVLDKIGTLSNLEYLDLSNNKHISTLPDSFSRLQKLHTLDLSGCWNLHKLPGNMGNLKFLVVKDFHHLARLPMPINNNLIPLLNFAVHAAEGGQRSNLILLRDADPFCLEISQLENVQYVDEAREIQLREKHSLKSLTLAWTSTGRFVEHMELLRELVPPSSLTRFELRGYSSVSFPAWLSSVAIYLPTLVHVRLIRLSQCTSLPPLGKLQNLKCLNLEGMPSITKIDQGLCGNGLKTLVQLEELTISCMRNLEEWSTAYSSGENGVADEFMFPNLERLKIKFCPKLRIVRASGRNVASALMVFFP